MTRIVVGVLHKTGVMEIMPGMTDEYAQTIAKAPRLVDQPVGNKGLDPMLVRAARIHRIADPIGIDPLDDCIVDMKDKPVDIDEQPPSKETAPAAQLIVDTILGLQRRSHDAVTFLELLDGRCREAAAGAGIDGNVGQ